MCTCACKLCVYKQVNNTVQRMCVAKAEDEGKLVCTYNA